MQLTNLKLASIFTLFNTSGYTDSFWFANINAVLFRLAGQCLICCLCLSGIVCAESSKRLTIQANESNFQLIINEKIFQADKKNFTNNFPAGELYSIVARKTGCKDIKREIELKVGTFISVEFVCKAVLRVVSNVEYYKLIVDDNEYDVSQRNYLLALPIGKHDITARKEGCDEITQSVSLSRISIKQIELRFDCSEGGRSTNEDDKGIDHDSNKISLNSPQNKRLTTTSDSTKSLDEEVKPVSNQPSISILMAIDAEDWANNNNNKTETTE